MTYSRFNRSVSRMNIPLRSVREGETVEAFFDLTNGLVYRIENLKLNYESDSNTEVIGPKHATLSNVEGTGGSIRASIKCRLKSRARGIEPRRLPQGEGEGDRPSSPWTAD